jgi:4-amino-4-deoxy-L-arabinose transferase-like glycosyltransferase
VSSPAPVTSALPPPAGRQPRVLPVWPVLAVCVAVRLWYLGTPQAAVDGDEALTGLMVRRILDGRLYAFLAGQEYNGALEQYAQAVVWAVLPRTPYTLRLPQVGLAVLACWLVHRVGREMLGERRAWLAAALFALGPYFLVVKGVRSHGPYPTSQVLGLLGLWIALRLRPGGPAARRQALAFGLVGGLALWTSWSAAYLVLPAAVALAPLLRRWPGLLAPVGTGALVGYLPALAWAVAHRQVPLLGGPQPELTPLQRLRLLGGPVIREFVGVGYLDAAPGWPVALQTAAVVGLAGAYVTACWRRRAGLADLVLLRDSGRRRPADVLLLVPPVVAVLYAMSKYTWWAGEPRYLFAVYPALALGLAALVPRTRPRLAGPVAVGLVLAVGGTSVVTLGRHSGEGAGRDDCLRSAGAWLSDRGVRAAYSDYWTGLPLQLLAGDRLGLSIGPMRGGRTRFPELRRAADAAPPAYVLSRAPDPMRIDEDQVAAMDRALAARGVRATRTEVGCVTVWTDLDPPLRPVELGRGLPLP